MKYRQMKSVVRFFLLASLSIGIPLLSKAESKPTPIRIGYVGSLSSFAAAYGTAVLEGARLAVDELAAAGTHVELIVEDDNSESRQTVSAFNKLITVNHVRGLIGGSWWVNAIVKPAERVNVPLISCETVFDKDSLQAPNYFIMQGDLREWVRTYEPLVADKKLTRGATVRFASGFGATIADEMKQLFSKAGRSYVGTVEYQDIQVQDAASVVARLKQLHADAVYIDAQPGGFAAIARKMMETGLGDITILTNSIARDAIEQKLIDPSKLSNFYYSLRAQLSRAFALKFKDKYGREPQLQSDLGYFSTLLLVQGLKTDDPVATLRNGLTVEGRPFHFDHRNLLTGVVHTVYRYSNGLQTPLIPLTDLPAD